MVMVWDMTALLFYALTLTISSTQNVICIEWDEFHSVAHSVCMLRETQVLVPKLKTICAYCYCWKL